MKKKVKDLKPGEIFAMPLNTGLVDVPVQVIPQHIHPETLADLEINCHGHSPMFDTGLIDIWEGYIENE